MKLDRKRAEQTTGEAPEEKVPDVVVTEAETTPETPTPTKPEEEKVPEPRKPPARKRTVHAIPDVVLTQTVEPVTEKEIEYRTAPKPTPRLEPQVKFGQLIHNFMFYPVTGLLMVAASAFTAGCSGSRSSTPSFGEVTEVNTTGNNAKTTMTLKTKAGHKYEFSIPIDEFHVLAVTKEEYDLIKQGEIAARKQGEADAYRGMKDLLDKQNDVIQQDAQKAATASNAEMRKFLLDQRPQQDITPLATPPITKASR